MIMYKFIILVVAIFLNANCLNEYQQNVKENHDHYKINSAIDEGYLASFLSNNNNKRERYSTTYFTLLDLNFLGSWYSTSSQKPFNYFTNDQGKLYLNMDRTNANAFNILLYDGNYIDNKKANILIHFNNITDYMGNSTWKGYNAYLSIIFQDESSNSFGKNCSGAYFIQFIDANSNLPSSNYTNISHPTQMNVNFSINMQYNIDTQCSVSISGSGSSNDIGLQSDTMKFSMIITLICIINLYSTIHLIKHILENELDAKRFSLISLSLMVFWDVYLCLFLLSSSLEDYQFFHYFITPAFWYFILVSIFETRLISIIWKIKYQDQFATTTDLNSGIVTFYINFYGAMIIFLIVGYSFIPNSLFFYITGFYFIPQIIHSALRGQKCKINGNYIIGIGLLRIFVPLYVKSCPANIFELTPDPTFLWWYMSIIAFQVLILTLQAWFGSRFFIPSFLLPPPFNYYRKFSRMAKEIENEDCPICMDSLAREPIDLNSELLKSPVDVHLMVTPCKHKFHQKCLQEWLKIKLDCPFCRQNLPGLD